MEKFKFIEPELIKAGSDKLRLGLMRYAPKVDCRVLSEDTYQEMKKAYDIVCGGGKADTGDRQLTIPDVNNLVCPTHGTKLYKHPDGMAYCSLCNYSIQWQTCC